MVKNILLTRHCEASYQSETNRDFDRPLTENGQKQAEMLGDFINGLDLTLDAIYVSPALRTMQTTQGIIKSLEKVPRLMDAEEFYEATDNVLKAAVNRFDPLFNSVAMVAHNPAIHQLFSHFTLDFRDYSPGTCAWLQFEVDDWQSISANSATVKDFFYPGSYS